VWLFSLASDNHLHALPLSVLNSYNRHFRHRRGKFLSSKNPDLLDYQSQAALRNRSGGNIPLIKQAWLNVIRVSFLL
jgi:hypothetical protein